MTASNPTIELLATTKLFGELTADQLTEVAKVAVPRRFAPGEAIFHAHDEGDTCYIVRTGHARALHESPDGRAVTLAHFGPCEVFGELALFGNEPRSATVEAIDDLEIVAILGDDMRRLLHQHPGIAVQLLMALGKRLRAANARIAGQSFQNVRGRVAKVLIEQIEAAQREGADESEIVVHITQAEIAQLADSSRESASRFLAVLERNGAISQGRGRITVHTPSELARYSD